MAAIHHTHEYRLCVQEMKSRGRFQKCITAGQHPRCHIDLDATVRKGKRGHMTLGHYQNVEDGGAPYDPRNYGPQCAPCNYSEGGHISRQKLRGVNRQALVTSPDWT